MRLQDGAVSESLPQKISLLVFKIFSDIPDIRSIPNFIELKIHLYVMFQF